MIQPRVSDFIESLQPVASEVGVETARELVKYFGGTRLFIPQHWTADLNINVIGETVAKQLCRLFGPERIAIPMTPFKLEAQKRFTDELRESGCSNSEIARALGVSYRTVTRMSSGTALLTRKRHRLLDDRQIDLEELLAKFR
ncbi:MAG: hypothetical protein LCH61_20450 [Proteobacteria bacterium]|nr:hypothetical protein [Pseudomonadota bacterium]